MNPEKASRRRAAAPLSLAGRTAGTVAASEIWRVFSKEFDDLAGRENELLNGRSRSDFGLRASCLYDGAHSGSGRVRLSGGATPRLVSEFQDIGTRAGIALACPSNARPVEFWIHCLCQDLLKTKNPELSPRSKSGGIIQ